MECDICGRESALHCVTCARGFIEDLRIEQAKAMISNGEITKHIKAVIEGSEDKESQYVSLQDSKGGLLVDRQECTNHIDIQRIRSETVEMKERTSSINEQADLLRRQLEDARKELAEKRRLMALRKSDFSSATYGVATRRANEHDKVQQAIKRLNYESDKVHSSTMDMRSYLCDSAAKIAGLKQVTRRMKDGSILETWNIGPGRSVRVWDLRDLNDAPPDELSASLLGVTQLLIRVTAYLGVRLPSEITLPHKDYPHPTIISPEESWEGKKVPFPGSTPSHSSSNSPEASRTLEGISFPRVRVLFLDRPLSDLRKEDNAAYSAFIEAVAQLGYNVAWLCRFQGMKDDILKWEDACEMGKNLHRLLILQETRLSQRPENPLDKDIPQSKSSSDVVPKARVGLGELSYATSHSFALAGHNVQRVGEWKLTFWKMYAQLKRYLYAEEQTRDWDNLDPKEWEDMDNAIKDDPVLVGKRQHEGDSTLHHGANTNRKAGEASEGGEERKRGVNGWTRVKSRSEETGKKPAAE